MPIGGSTGVLAWIHRLSYWSHRFYHLGAMEAHTRVMGLTLNNSRSPWRLGGSPLSYVQSHPDVSSALEPYKKANLTKQCPNHPQVLRRNYLDYTLYSTVYWVYKV
jgi:hypothetical protein